jgi:hypothetical protein
MFFDIVTFCRFFKFLLTFCDFVFCDSLSWVMFMLYDVYVLLRDVAAPAKLAHCSRYSISMTHVNNGH